MIAIMILGIGMVMVATVFPIGLGITRETLQMSIAIAAADAAEATVKLKVPAFKDLTPDDGYNGPGERHQRTLIPNVENIELEPGPEPDNGVAAAIIEPELEVINACKSTDPWVPRSYDNWEEGWKHLGSGTTLAPGTQDVFEFIDRTRVFTERSGWAADLEAMHDATAAMNKTFVLPAQNVRILPPPAPGQPGVPEAVTDLPPSIAAAGVERTMLPRIHLADRVYPPVEVEYDPETQAFFDPVTDQAMGDSEIAQVAVEQRRYAWTVIHHHTLPDKDDYSQIITIVVTHRGQLGARFARQQDKDSGPDADDLQFDPAADRDLLLAPEPDNNPTRTDRAFPQPWLVMLNRIDGRLGTVRCTMEVARLLPPDSFFVIAQTTGPFVAGTAHKVSGRTWDPAEPTALLEIARSGSGADDVPVWVFPPAIESRTAGREVFSSRTPVVGVSLRRVTPR